MTHFFRQASKREEGDAPDEALFSMPFFAKAQF
jgi:hypothetical protein